MQVGEPQSEVVIRGPREGFVEVIRTNVAMIRSTKYQLENTL
jgi:spore germination protein KA